jgi:HK97 family phage major capsid protein
MSDRIAFAGTTTSEGRRLKGSVQLAGQRTFRNGEWVEIDPAALVKADATDVFARIDHDPARVVGRTKNGTLSILRTDQGFEFETGDLPNTTYANDALELAKGGYFGGSSFEIEGMKSKFSTDPDGIRVRTITSIKRLVDVSPVLDPAFASTAAAFSKESEMADEPKDPQPKPDEPDEAKPKVQFTAPKPDSDWAEIAKHASDDHLSGTVDALFAASNGNLEGYQREQYTAFVNEIQSRKRQAAMDQSRFAQDKARHDAIMGRLPSAPKSELFASDDYTEAFTRYLKTGDSQVMEQFAQTIAGDGSQGGFTVPDGFVNKLTMRLLSFGGIASVASEITTSTGESLRWPYIDDTANKAQLVAEDTQATTGADLVFSSLELGAFEYDATGASGEPIEVSLPLLQDSAFDIEALLLKVLGERIGRKQADHWATGGGGTEPVGLFTGKAADTMTATAVSLAAPEHMFQIDSAYRNNARWVMSDTTLAKIWTSQTTTNQPMFLPGGTIADAPFGTLYGKPITIDNSAGNYVAFGDINAAYIIRRVRGVQLLVDPYSAQKRRAVQYHAWARADGNIQDPNAVSVSSWSGVSADT